MSHKHTYTEISRIKGHKNKLLIKIKSVTQKCREDIYKKDNF